MANFEPPIYTLKDVKLRFGTNQLFRGVELYINRGDKISLIGRNGSGKSTLLKIIAGLQEIDDGEIFIQPGTKIGYMPQDADLSGYKNLREVVLSGLDDESSSSEYKAQILIEQLGIEAEQNPEKASGGEKRKATLAKALISEPDILLLDEPTNHLDMPTIELLEKIIISYAGAVVLISHDRYFLRKISRTTFWLDRGVMRRNNKGFEFFEEWQEQIIEQEIIAQKYLDKKLAEETEWLHKGVTARRRRNQGRLRRLLQLRQERREQIKQIGSVNIDVENTVWKSKIVLEAKHITKCFEKKTIVKDFSIKVIRGNRIGIVGPNGAGKTTLIKLLTKKLQPDDGFVRIGKNLQEAYFDQNRFSLNPQKTLWQTLCDEGDHLWVRGSYRHVVAYLKDFLFTPEQAKSPVATLSGGEKNRLMLAKILSQPSNFLLLDEPTNDLDMDTLDLLQEMLSEYDGTMIVVSHDRDFLDRLVTSIIYMKGDGSVEEFVGSYSDFLEKAKASTLQKTKTKVAPQQEKVKFIPQKKLTYNQQRLLQILPDKIAKLEQQLAEISQKLSDADLYQNNREQFFALTDELKEIQNQKSEAEDQWLEISLLAEELSTTAN
ncbi:MAG: ABC-F family ATP-binding cassette domain-containing protein [Alphaproteobacteria bacterium]|nr:ABC-F family ATP-binding cassette domain-containing protein [Alphaproteobacteria bacterium]